MRAGRLAAGWRLLHPPMMRRSIPILCYHAIDASDDADGTLGHPRQLFAQHLDVIQRLGFVTISGSDLLDICAGARPLDRRYVVLTFDDGHVSHWMHAAPMLAQRGMKGVFCAVTDFIRPGSPRGPAQAPPALPAGSAFRRAAGAGDCSSFMNESELAAIVRDLGMEVFSHTAAHAACFRSLRRIGHVTGAGGEHWTARAIYREPRAGLPLFDHGSAYAYNGFWPRDAPGDAPLYRLRPDAERYDFCLEDFRRSIAKIAAVHQPGRQLLCWPWGQFDPLAEEAARAAGFAGAFTLERTPNGPGTDPFRLGRIRVRPARGAGWLAARLVLHMTAPLASLLAKRYNKRPETRRVLYLTDSTNMSGGGRQLLINVTAMAAHGVDALVAAPPGSAIAGEAERRGVPVVPWEQSRRVVHSARFVAGLARSRGVDIVHVFHGRPVRAAVLAKLFGGPYRLYLNRGVTYTPNVLAPLFALVADGVICNSHAAARVLRRHLVPASRISVVYNALEAADPRGETGWAEGPARERTEPLRVMWAGNANPIKGFDILCQLAANYASHYHEPPVSFLAYGLRPPDTPGAQGADDPASPIRVMGEVDHDALRRAMARAEVFLLTSRRESLPNVLLEAFDAGMPVVCTDTGGVAEIVEDGVNGWVRPIEDVDALADAVRDLVVNPQRRAGMGAVNRRLASSFFGATRKGYLLLRVYSGERVADTLSWEGPAWKVPTP